MVSDRSSVEATELRSVIFFYKKGTRDPKTIILMVWDPSTKVHALFVLSKHVRQKIVSHR